MTGDRLLRLPDVAARYGLSEKTVRRRLVTRDGSIAAPAFDHPWRWRASDVDAHIAGNVVLEQRRTRARRLAAATLVMILAAVPSVAQETAVHVDKAALGLAEGATWPAELDGDPDTREWIQYRVTPAYGSELRGVALRDDQVCTGAWFNPWRFVPMLPGDLLLAGGITRVGRLDLFVANGQQSYAEVRIHYGCP